MPFLVHVQIRESTVSGMGVFALEEISEGSVIWVFECENPVPVAGYDKKNRALTKEQLQSIEDDSELKTVLQSGYYFEASDVFLELRDGCQFTNHSDQPNSATVYATSQEYRELKKVAVKPIKKGDEIFSSYFVHFVPEPEWLVAMFKKHLPWRVEFRLKLEEKLLASKQQAQ